MAHGDLVVEYRELGNNIRHYANIRFVQLTLFFAVSGGLAKVVFTSHPPLGEPLRTVFKVGGLVFALAFALMEERAGDYWTWYQDRAAKIEETLGYEQYSKRPKRRYVSGTNAGRAVFAFTVLFWAMSLIWRYVLCWLTRAGS